MTLHPNSTSTLTLKAFEGLENAFNAIHNSTYDYTNSVYISAKLPLVIKCKLHGDFSQRAADHKRGQGCPTCAHQRKARTTAAFIEEASKVHKDFYTYLRTQYTNAHTKVRITCPDHGDFLQTPHNHLNGHGCYTCGRDTTENAKRLSMQDVINKGNIVHSNKYTYHNTTTLCTIRDRITIICPVHGEFTQVAADHLSGNGCQICGALKSKSTYLNEPTLLYYIYFPSSNTYKIGITLTRVGLERRYKADKLVYVVIDCMQFSTGKQAYLMEQYILNKNTEFAYHGTPILKGGNTELFTLNILKDYNDKIKQYLENEGYWKESALMEPRS